MEYTQTEFDAFGWSTLARSELPLCETHGLEFDTARDATPRWYGVSFGNGNDGVSHMFPDYYVKTAEPFRLAAAAMIASFKPGAGYRFAAENTSIDGEADYTICAMILDPPEEETETIAPDYESIATDNGFTVDARRGIGFAYINSDGEESALCETAENAWKACCEDNDLIPEEEDIGSWSEANGAWLCCEVFPVELDDMRDGRPQHESLLDCFSETELAVADTV